MHASSYAETSHRTTTASRSRSPATSWVESAWVSTHTYRGTIGYWVAAPARGQGICTRALRLLSRHALDELKLQRLELITDPDNVASQRVAEKVGFQREGVLRAHLRHPDGRIRDSVMFSLLPRELRE
jgi:RimJ/RimL family protein N-acetyltransferase